MTRVLVLRMMFSVHLRVCDVMCWVWLCVGGFLTGTVCVLGIGRLFYFCGWYVVDLSSLFFWGLFWLDFVLGLVLWVGVLLSFDVFVWVGCCLVGGVGFDCFGVLLVIFGVGVWFVACWVLVVVWLLWCLQLFCLFLFL